jgi:pimeloyl-ACP methyl ester carboxylesterase
MLRAGRLPPTARNVSSVYLAVLFIAAFLVVAGTGCSPSSTSVSQTETGPPSLGIRWAIQPKAIPGLQQRTVGAGAQAAILLWRNGQVPSQDAVVFLHGWSPLPPFLYGAWLRHLAYDGNTIVYPVYQRSRDTKPETFREAAVAGIAAGLRAIHANERHLIVIGHTTGGALAFDYAAVAPRRHLPEPRGVLAVYPGRDPGNGRIVAAGLSAIPADTDLEVIGGPGDPLPHGEAEATKFLRAATSVQALRKTLLRSGEPNVGGPVPGTAAARKAFWGPADRLIARARERR